MNRPKRSAAERAKSLIAQGFGVKEIDERGGDGLSEEEEDLLDILLMNGGGNNENIRDDPDDPTCPTVPDPNDTSKTFFSYGDTDSQPNVHSFKPCRPVGPHLLEHATRHGVSQLTRAIDFFKLFFTDEIIEVLVENSNTYAMIHILDKQSYSRYQDGSWEPITVQEMSNFIGLVILMGLNPLPEIPQYWATTPPFSGSWARRYMSRNRFKAILGMMHVSDPADEDPSDKLCKLWPLLDMFKSVCHELYQPERDVAIDERMVKSKARSGMKQFMPQKPIRFGFKIWCLCESSTGYTINFNVYTGKRESPGPHGLAYDVVMKLICDHLQQGYRLYIDNFYTSIALLKELRKEGVDTCGTTIVHRKGFPQALRDKEWAKKAKRGDMRYVRDNDILCMQWMDTKQVSLCSTFHAGHTFSMAKRNVKDPKGQNRVVYVKKPEAVGAYSASMGGVDLSDQLLQPYNVRIKSQRWWKTLFFHLIDIAIVNAHILFKKWRQHHPNEEGLERLAGFSQMSFRAELTKQLAGISDDESVPLCTPYAKHPSCTVYHTSHIPVYHDTRKNCKVCYYMHGQELKTKFICMHPKCQVPLCITPTRNCMQLWHSPEFDQHREAVLQACRHK